MSEECKVEDILCQIKVLQSMRELKTAVGDETFLRDFPELQGLDTKLTEKIKTTTGDLKEAIAKCANIPIENVGLGSFESEEVIEEEE